MDNRPAHLAPLGGAFDREPFDAWWERVRRSFPTVPEEVGYDWLYRNWHGPSPHQDMCLNRYRFVARKWPSAKLSEILSDVSNYSHDPRCGIRYGREQVTGDARKHDSLGLADFVESNGTFPVPITVVDNCDGHLAQRGLPAGYVLIEGHRRHSMGLYLTTQNMMADEVPIWLMSLI